ncbi:hypothetical protein [Nocardia sp. CA-120079]|uniref:hypothetical protein n=1 Tax=Nocardia sp. CA-120079 TaxID=3239974 RepID=UPI003D97BC60
MPRLLRGGTRPGWSSVASWAFTASLAVVRLADVVDRNSARRTRDPTTPLGNLYRHNLY